MREIDFTSVLVAALIGALVLWLFKRRLGLTRKRAIVTGLIVGTAVQVGVRLTGVS